MNSRVVSRKSPELSNAGYYVSLFGSALILLWLGVFKFTPTEAAAIKGLMISHPLSSWMYTVFSVQMVSNIIGVVEILISLLLLMSLKLPAFKRYAGWGMIGTFLFTLSFLITTPGVWKTVDGMPITDFFILKDMMYLGFGFMLISSPSSEKSKIL